jgi:hypothetical protein
MNVINVAFQRRGCRSVDSHSKCALQLSVCERWKSRMSFFCEFASAGPLRSR